MFFMFFFEIALNLRFETIDNKCKKFTLQAISKKSLTNFAKKYMEI